VDYEKDILKTKSDQTASAVFLALKKRKE